MNKKHLHLESELALLALATLFCLPVSAQSVSAQSAAQTKATAQTQSTAQTQTNAQTNTSTQDNAANRDELARFDQFLDGHREIADQLRRDPSLADKPDYLKDHPALQSFLQDHPGVSDQLKNDPNAFMREADRFNRRDDNRGPDFDRNRAEVASFNQFLDSHREISEQVRRNPSVVDNEEFVKGHPALQTYLQSHPWVRDQLHSDPNGFVREADNINRGDNNFDRNRDELASFDRFLDSHREISEQVRKNPSLVDNGQFVKDHPALQSYLQEHPGVRDQLRNDPNAFVREADRDNRFEDNRDRYLGQDRKELASFNQFLNDHHEIAEQLRKDHTLVDNDDFVKSHPALQSYLQEHPEVRNVLKNNPNGFLEAEARFNNDQGGMDRNGLGKDMDRDDFHRHFGEFLGGHADIARQLSENPSLVKNQDFLNSHPELKDYLNANPDVREQLMANPDTFVKSSQQFSTNSTVKTPTVTPGKPNQ